MVIPDFATQVRGTKSGRSVLHEEAQRVQAARLVKVYENHEFSLPSPSTNQPLSTFTHTAGGCLCNRGAFTLIDRAQTAYIRNRGTTTVTLRFNDTDEDAITLEAGEYLQFDFLEITEIYMTNATGVAITLKILLG